MSTHLVINEGFRFAPDMDAFDVAHMVQAVLAPVHHREQVLAIAIQVARIVDHADLSGQPRPESVIFDAVAAHNAHMTSGGEHECLGSETVVQLWQEKASGRVYTAMDTIGAESMYALTEIDGAEFYPYWDEALNTRMLGCSSRAWAERRRTWTRLIEGPSLELKVGKSEMGFDILSYAKDILAAIPGEQERVANAMRAFMQENSGHPAQIAELLSSAPAKANEYAGLIQPITLEDLGGAA